MLLTDHPDLSLQLWIISVLSWSSLDSFLLSVLVHLGSDPLGVLDIRLTQGWGLDWSVYSQVVWRMN